MLQMHTYWLRRKLQVVTGRVEGTHSLVNNLSQKQRHILESVTEENWLADWVAQMFTETSKLITIIS